MGQSPSDRRNTSREQKTSESTRETRSGSFMHTHANGGSSGASQDNVAPRGACGGLSKDVVMPFHKWLTMEEKQQQRHLQHARKCILSPFLFKRTHEYCEKILIWLHQQDLLPKSRNLDSLTDKNIEVSEYAEEVADTILSGMIRKDFLFDIFQVREQLKECTRLTEVLRIAEDSELVQVVWKCSSFVGHLVKEDSLLIVMSVLNQALLHIEMASDSTIDHLADFERQLCQQAQVCEGLRLKGNRHFKEKHFRQASVFYSKAIHLRPFDHVLYGNRAQSYLNTTQYREALSDARRAICLNPSWEKGHFRYAKAYYELGYYEKAIAVNSKALTSCTRIQELQHQAVQFSKDIGGASAGCGLPPGNKHSSRDKAKKAKIGQNELSSSSPNSKRKRLNSLGQHSCIPASHHRNPDLDDMPELLPSISDKGMRGGPGLQQEEESNLRVQREDDNEHVDDDDHNDDDDDMQCTCEDCHHSIDLDSLPSLMSDTSLSDDCCDDISDDHEDNDDDDDDDDDIPDLHPCSDDERDNDEMESSEDDDDEFPFMGPFGGMPNPTELFIGGALVLDLIRQFLEAHPEMQGDDTPPPALPQVIESLPRVQITQREIDASSSCCICQCDFEMKEEVTRLPCEHTFHEQCVTTWLRMHATCPTCRDELPH